MNLSSQAYNTFNTTWWMLKISYGLVYIVAGADKFTNLIVVWIKYLNLQIPASIEVDPVNFIYIVGIIEIAIGLVTLSKWTKTGAFLIATWLLLIIINLLSLGTFFDIVVRDTLLAISALSLVFLTTIREQLQVRNQSVQ